MKHALILIMVIAGCLSNAISAEPEVRKQFITPRDDQATVPLWFVNGKLTKKEITKQIEDAQKSGFSGFTTLSVSLTNPRFLTEGYFEMYGHMLSEARRLGMEVVYYDDMDFPSGIAAHRFRKTHPKHVMKSLMRHEKVLNSGGSFTLAIPDTEQLMSAMAYRMGTAEKADLRPAKGSTIRWKAPSDGWRVTVCTLKDTGCGIVDYLDSEACDRFIDMTYEVVYKRFSEHFGTTIRQVFFDDVSMCHDKESRAWTPRFNESFKKRLGYDPARLYPALWHDIGPETSSARAALFGHRAWLMAYEGYPARINAWARKHRVISSGHTTDNYSLSPTNSGGDYMLFGVKNDSPLLDSIHWYGHGRSGYQVTSSTAYNFDRPRCTVEIYGNYRMPFKADMLYRSGMELFTRGANFFIPHAMWYNYKPRKKVYIKPLISAYNPDLADELPAYNKWAARHQILLEGGRHVSDIAILYPIEGLHATYRFDRPRKQKKEWGGEGLPVFDYLILSDHLMTRNHRDFTFLHPTVLNSSKCEVTPEGLALKNKVNYENYSVLFIPSSPCISEASLDKAHKFAASGGLVIATGQLPCFADKKGRSGAVRAKVKALFGVEPVNLMPKFGTRTIMSDGRKLDDATRRILESSGSYSSRAVGAKGGRAVHIPAITPELIARALAESTRTPDVRFDGVSGAIAPAGVFGYTHKVKAGLDLFLLANSTDKAIKATVKIRGALKNMEAWDPKTGDIRSLSARVIKDANGAKVTEAQLVLKPLTDVFWVGKRD